MNKKPLKLIFTEEIAKKMHSQRKMTIGERDGLVACLRYNFVTELNPTCRIQFTANGKFPDEYILSDFQVTFKTLPCNTKDDVLAFLYKEGLTAKSIGEEKYDICLYVC